MSATIENLKKQNIFFDQVVLANHTQSKEPKNKNPRFYAVKSGTYDAENMVWSNILKPHQIIAYFGDNIKDFPNLTQNAENKIFDNFSHGYFIMPNPMYGSWQNAN